MLSKSEIRTSIIEKCQLIDDSYRRVANHNICQNLLKQITQNIKKVAIYHAYGYEADLTKFIYELFHRKIEIYEPIAYKDRREMSFSSLSQQEYNRIKKNNCIKIFSDNSRVLIDEVEIFAIDLIIIPLVAISKKGYRLGKGGGYYDTIFANLNGSAKTILCGVGFDIQLIDDVPIEAWDIKLDYFISEKRVIKFSRNN